MFFVQKNFDFNKNETESEMENPTHSFNCDESELAKETKAHFS